MAVEWRKGVAVLRDVVTVEEAEGLLEGLIGLKRRKVDLGDCCHFHAAVLQVLLALRPEVVVSPNDPDLAKWWGWVTAGGSDE